jgi:hypothetical protein
MTKTASVAEVVDTGVTIEADEAVAIAQQLIAALRDGDNPHVAAPPFGPPTTANVYLGADGSVVCRGCETTPGVSEMAIFLQAMLASQSVYVPGGLRYTIARALLDVDVPPFDSLDDFADTLTRYERGPRHQIVRRVLQRADERRILVPVFGADRRRHPQATQLRRALREADARLYVQKLASEAVTVAVLPRPAPARRLHAAAACIAAGLLLIVTGEFIDGWHRPGAATPPLAPAAPAVVGDIALGPDESRTANSEPRTANPEPRTANSEPRTLNPKRRSSNPEPRPPSVKRASSRVAPAQQSRGSGTRRESRGVLDRLRLNWLRTVFVSS